VEEQQNEVMVKAKLISIIVPAYNEADCLPRLFDELRSVTEPLEYRFEFIFVNDGSSDSSSWVLGQIASDKRVRVLELARNFGKEIALTAGLHASQGQAAIMIDADLQHPIALLPEFLAKWEAGADVVVGVRQFNEDQNLLERFRSRLYYKIINSISDTKITPHATDYQLLDRYVIDEFNRFTERNRMTRGLIAWLGFHRDYIYFTSPKRADGQASYSTIKLVHLAMNSMISLSLFPLRVAGWLGVIITALSGAAGLFIYIERFILSDSLKMRFSGPAILAVILVFLVGIVLMCLGLIALYIASIHNEVVNRPIYVLRRRKNKSLS